MVRSVKGQNVDMQRLIAENRNAVAVGNMHVNAAGDSLGKNGVVTETADKKAKFFYKQVASTVKENVSLKDDLGQVDSITEPKAAKKPTKTTEVVEDNGDIVIKKD